MPTGSDLAFSYNPIATDDITGRRICRSDVPDSDPRHVTDGGAMHAASFVWGGVKATSRRPFWCPAPRAGAACGGGARKITTAALARQASPTLTHRQPPATGAAHPTPTH